MREIKFRAWDEKRKRMFTPYSQNFGVTIAQKNFFVGINSNGLEVSEYEGKGYWRILPVMQYTGLKDRSGKEACYKDVVKYEGWKYVVEWDDLNTGFYLADYKRLDDPLSEEHLIGSCITEGEIIGNIYENPELIEVIA